MQIIKSIDFLDKEKESINVIIDIWKKFCNLCQRNIEYDGFCERCVFSGFCRNADSLIGEGMERFKENLTDRI